jgi:uncharacterized pyridoxal phosphate-containing UPF0001 family protein
VDRAAAALGRIVQVLIEVNVAGEPTKYGCAPSEVDGLVRAVRRCRHLSTIGLMTIAPETDDPQTVRPVFRTLRRLRDDVRAGAGGDRFSELSMGMTADFEVAIEEGATMVRIGRAIFGERTF